MVWASLCLLSCVPGVLCGIPLASAPPPGLKTTHSPSSSQLLGLNNFKQVLLSTATHCNKVDKLAFMAEEMLWLAYMFIVFHKTK